MRWRSAEARGPLTQPTALLLPMQRPSVKAHEAETMTRLTIVDPVDLGVPADHRRLGRGREPARPPTRGSLFDRILVAVAEDSESTAAVHAAAELAVALGSEVLAVHVSCHDVPRFGPSAAECGLRVEDASLQRALRELRDGGVPHRGERWQAVDGRVLEALLQAADEDDASLMIVASSRRPGLTGWLRRGLGLRLAARTSRPVLIVRSG